MALPKLDQARLLTLHSLQVCMSITAEKLESILTTSLLLQRIRWSFTWTVARHLQFHSISFSLKCVIFERKPHLQQAANSWFEEAGTSCVNAIQLASGGLFLPYPFLMLKSLQERNRARCRPSVRCKAVSLEAYSFANSLFRITDGLVNTFVSFVVTPVFEYLL